MSCYITNIPVILNAPLELGGGLIALYKKYTNSRFIYFCIGNIQNLDSFNYKHILHIMEFL